jgi:DME family drug/metabolite transporter
MLILGAAGLGPGAMSAFFFMAGLGRVKASTAAVIVLLEPLVATLIGVFVWGEPMGVVGALGAVLMLWGMLLTLRHQTPH